MFDDGQIFRGDVSSSDAEVLFIARTFLILRA
jgi:hypothetical protein